MKTKTPSEQPNVITLSVTDRLLIKWTTDVRCRKNKAVKIFMHFFILCDLAYVFFVHFLITANAVVVAL